VDASNQNRIASVTDAAGRTLTFNYANGTFPRLCTSITDAVGTVASYTYDASALLTQVSYPDGSQLNFQYNDPNSSTLVSAVTDAQAKILEAHTYDSQRRGMSSQQANGVNAVNVAVYWNGQTGIRDSRSNFSWIYYVTLAQREYFSTSTGYGCASCGIQSPQQQYIDSSGNAVYRGDPFDLKPTQYTYDNQGNVLSVSKPYGNNYSFSIGGWNTWTYTYNSFGEVLTATDPYGHQTTNVYDANGNLLTVTTPPPNGSTPASATTFTYNANGTLHTIQDPLGNMTTLTYFTTGLIHTITDANNKVTT
jgi:YD repeat-containing protein